MTFDEYQKKALSTNINFGEYAFFDWMFGLVGETGEMAEKVKKWIRDDQADWDKLDKQALMGELGDVLWYAAVLANKLGYSLEEVVQHNVDKLASRQQRGKLKGSGDNR